MGSDSTASWPSSAILTSTTVPSAALPILLGTGIALAIIGNLMLRRAQ